MDQVVDQLERNERGRMVLDGMLREVVAKRIEMYCKLDEVQSVRGAASRAASTPGEKPGDAAPAPATTTEVRIDSLKVLYRLYMWFQLSFGFWLKIYPLPVEGFWTHYSNFYFNFL